MWGRESFVVVTNRGIVESDEGKDEVRGFALLLWSKSIDKELNIERTVGVGV